MVSMIPKISMPGMPTYYCSTASLLESTKLSRLEGYLIV